MATQFHAMEMLLDPASKGIFAWSESLTPSALAASIGMKEQAFTVNPPIPLVAGDVVFVNDPPGAVNANCAVVGARVTGAAQITLVFANLTAAANVPTSGVHGFVVVRP